MSKSPAYLKAFFVQYAGNKLCGDGNHLIWLVVSLNRCFIFAWWEINNGFIIQFNTSIPAVVLYR